jgi:diguanylate cyclase (GGDEF)-like protein/PAS domain S-box-containing protein
LNAVAESMTGWPLAEAKGKPLAEVFNIVDASSHEPWAESMMLAIRENRTVNLSTDCLLIRRDGHESSIEHSAAPIHDRGGRIAGAVIVFRDVAAARDLSAQLMHLAQHDVLTDLPNRGLLNDRLQHAISVARRYRHRAAVLFMDLDHFKHVNDSLGHVVGDQLLQAVAQRLKTCVRRSDTVGRQGGDEFVVGPPFNHTSAELCLRIRVRQVGDGQRHAWVATRVPRLERALPGCDQNAITLPGDPHGRGLRGAVRHEGGEVRDIGPVEQCLDFRG